MTPIIESPTPRTDAFSKEMYDASCAAAYGDRREILPEQAYALALDLARTLEIEFDATVAELADCVRGLFDARGCEYVASDGCHEITPEWMERCRAALVKHQSAKETTGATAASRKSR